MKTDNGRSVSVWMATADTPTSSRLATDQRCDVCVVGAGISGLFHFRENFALEFMMGGLWGRDSALTREIREGDHAARHVTMREWLESG